MAEPGKSYKQHTNKAGFLKRVKNINCFTILSLLLLKLFQWDKKPNKNIFQHKLFGVTSCILFYHGVIWLFFT